MIPQHYSRDITKRCQSLICSLGLIVEGDLQDDDEFGGTLRTTFLLAMAMPMIILPFDRIFKPGTGKNRVGNDRELDKQLADDVDDVLGRGKTFGEAPFVKNNSWSYVPNHARFNIAGTWLSKLLDALADSEAIKAAGTAPVMSRLMLKRTLRTLPVIEAMRPWRAGQDQHSLYIWPDEREAPL